MILIFLVKYGHWLNSEHPNRRCPRHFATGWIELAPSWLLDIQVVSSKNFVRLLTEGMADSRFAFQFFHFWYSTSWALTSFACFNSLW
jgi:hypothetical protein